MKSIIDKIYESKTIEFSELKEILESKDIALVSYLHSKAKEVAIEHFGQEIYIRGLIEISNYCSCGCYYCGISRENTCVKRFRLSKEEILDCAEKGYSLGFRTFVLQGGEDPYFSDEVLGDIVYSIKEMFPDTAVTLSVGERSLQSYAYLKKMGADRYLLRHETANPIHYGKLHPEKQTLEHRINCLWDLKELGYQVGCGFMVGSPFQTLETIYEDLKFILDFQPQMVGIGPFIPQHDTRFREYPSGSVDQTLRLLSILRLLMPNVLLPSTTALSTLSEHGRMDGILCGCNVVMPNLSPKLAKENYTLYDNKAVSGLEDANELIKLKEEFKKYGYFVTENRGDYRRTKNV